MQCIGRNQTAASGTRRIHASALMFPKDQPDCFLIVSLLQFTRWRSWKWLGTAWKDLVLCSHSILWVFKVCILHCIPGCFDNPDDQVWTVLRRISVRNNYSVQIFGASFIPVNRNVSPGFWLWLANCVSCSTASITAMSCWFPVFYLFKIFLFSWLNIHLFL